MQITISECEYLLHQLSIDRDKHMEVAGRLQSRLELAPEQSKPCLLKQLDNCRRRIEFIQDLERKIKESLND